MEKVKLEALKFTSVESSNVGAIAMSDGNMYVKFNTGSIYRYDNVPQSVFDDMLSAESKGKFFNAHVKNTYNYEKVS